VVFLEGSTPALPPKISVMREHDPKVKNSQAPNKFGAQKFRHQPLAKASGMNAWRQQAVKFHATDFSP